MIRVACGLASLISCCTSACTYLDDRLRDLRDMVDIKYSVKGDWWNAGVKAEACVLASGIGYGTYEETVEFFGRAGEAYPSVFIYAGYGGNDGMRNMEEGGPQELSMLFILGGATRVGGREMLHRAHALRVGGELLLPGVGGGAYVNLAEVGDFFLGLFGIDFANDDGLEPFIVRWTAAPDPEVR